MARVSVIIPSYNCESFLAQTLDSVFAQDINDLELIVVDDGSTDATRSIAASYSPRVKLIEQENAGVCVARNRGIQAASGDYICLMDHDDYWFPNKLSLQLAQFGQNPDVGVVYSAFSLWLPDASGTFPAPDQLVEKDVDGVDEEYSGWIYHLFLLDCWMLTSTAMFRREVFERCGVFDPSLPYSEDWDLWLRISLEYPFMKLRNATTLYRQHPKQGNRLSRPIDYRTELLRTAVARWGLCSPDGRCLSRHKFNQQLAYYHAGFGFGHLNSGNRKVAIASFLKAWITDPRKLKYLAYILATLFGWKPKW